MVNAVQHDHVDKTEFAEVNRDGLAARVVGHRQHLGEVGRPAAVQDAVSVGDVDTAADRAIAPPVATSTLQVLEQTDLRGAANAPKRAQASLALCFFAD